MCDYMEFVAGNPQLESESFKSLFEERYGTRTSTAGKETLSLCLEDASTAVTV